MRHTNPPADSTVFAWLGSSSGLRVSPLLVSIAQNIIAGNGVGISHELINLEVTSPEVPDLTLIDLPGITRVAVENQPQDIGLQVSLSATWECAPRSAGGTSEVSAGSPQGSGAHFQPTT